MYYYYYYYFTTAIRTLHIRRITFFFSILQVFAAISSNKGNYST
jgi:hypothetical protein